MKPNLFNRPMVVIAVTTDDNRNDEQAQLNARIELMKRLAASGHIVDAAIGYYQGERELVVIALLPNDLDHLVRCVELARDDYRQQCVLYVDPEGKGHLVDKECCIDYLGKCVVIQKGAWVSDPMRPDNRTELADGRFFHFVR
ncbi:hypothetical protein Ahp1_09 [Aeromonas phage Ahp1]|uniref:Uncharacterized protein n=1 Tax=Aeromonas phage Ahp1 TaxID=1747286 RepID=A0A1S5Q8A3_9CAUD|nr:hypothetical protein HOS19_gp09 [Aeromonas phage Ahp1]ALP47728.1 hypothetical protein Ahp1_09 [Aeromonas phage Ahp1]